MRVVLTEKPSVARDLARVLGMPTRGDGVLEGQVDGERTLITWCLGHLVELDEPSSYDPAWKRWSLDTLPMLPEAFQLKPRKGIADRWQVVRRVLRDRRVRTIVNACDAGREGELIFRYVYDLAGASAPVERLWLASLTDRAIREAWARIEPAGRYDTLGDAARCRSEADWLVGLNATRAMTCHGRRSGGDRVLSVGRVQTPTLAMVVARDREIEAFVAEPFWRVEAQFEVAGEGEPARWTGRWFRWDAEEAAPAKRGSTQRRDDDEDGLPVERLSSVEDAAAIRAATEGQRGTVEHAERKAVRDRPPLLHDLTSLQRRANQRYGLSADTTLAVAQRLYERKLITYPRTDARYLTPDQVPELPGIARGIGQMAVYAPHVEPVLERLAAGPPGKRVIDAREVGDHHAILPTGTPAPGSLSADEKRVFDLVARRFLAALSADAVFDNTTLVVAVPPGGPLPGGVRAPLRYRAKGRVLVEPGWRAVDPPGRHRDAQLPQVTSGSEAAVGEVRVKEGQTKPPRHYTDATLLRAMETAGRQLDDAALRRAMRGAGLGTPATRAAILNTLITRKFIARRGRDIVSTEGGRALIDAVPVDAVKSAQLTGEWEKRLTDVAEGRLARGHFMREVRAYTREVVEAIRGAAAPAAALVAREPKPVLGACPICGTDVTEKRSVFSCQTDRACAFVVFKTMSGRAISPTLVKALLRDGKSKIVKGFKSKSGKAFSAGLSLKDDGTVGFHFPPRVRVGDPCPECGEGQVVRGRKALGCSRWRAGCKGRWDLPGAGRPPSALP